MSRTAVSRGSGARGKTFHTKAVHPMRSCFGVPAWPWAAACGAAPAARCGTAVPPIPASTAFVNVRRFTESPTETSPFRRSADCRHAGGGGRKLFEPLFAYCANSVRSSYTNGAGGCQARRSRPWEENSVDHPFGSAFAGEPSPVPARHNGRRSGADDRAPARHRRIADHAAERSHHDRAHRRREDGRRPCWRLPQDAGRSDPRHLRCPSGDPRTRSGRGQSAVWRFEMRRASRFPRAAGAAGHRCRGHRHRGTLASADWHGGGAPREAHVLREAAQRHAGRRPGTA